MPSLTECANQLCGVDGVLVVMGLLAICAGVWMTDPAEVYKIMAAGLVGTLVRPKA